MLFLILFLLCGFANVLAFYIPSCTSLLLMEATAFGGKLALLFFSCVVLWCIPVHYVDGDGDFWHHQNPEEGSVQLQAYVND